MQHQSLYKALLSRKVAFGATLGAAVLFMALGVILWGGFNWGMEITNTESFCISCHEMKDNVYAEYVGSVHDGNRSGVKATCPDCHVPRPWVHKIVRKIQASNEVFHWLRGTVNTPEKFDSYRLTMANRVWAAMKETDSRECRNCHDWDTMNPERQQPRARNQHLFAMEQGHTCIDCHKGIAHKAVHTQLSEEELEEIKSPIAAYKREVPQSFLDGLARAKAAEEAADLAAQEQSRKEREQRQALMRAEQERIEAAVAAALAAAGTAAGGVPEAPQETAPAGGLDSGVDWGAVPERRITLFYPGQTSMEWTLVGSLHGGALPFIQGGDRCATCHDKETEAMGTKMVTGQKAETTPIPGKRPGIPVTVQAAHDTEHLYLRFQWEDGGHVPVPFVEGGKMDPANPVKLALMLATDEVKYAGQAGCWGTCHEDLRGMPGQPEDAAASGLPLDLSEGVTKYIAASRTEIEEKGRRGKALGGWDKLKDAEAIQAELAKGQFMDLLRVNGGDGSTEDGFVLAERVMQGGQGFDASIQNEAGYWTLTLKRRMSSDQPGDISIEPGKVYNFGFAIHDDHADGRFHHVSLGYKLALDDPTAEINAVGQ